MKNIKLVDLIRDSFKKALDIYQKNWKVIVQVAIVYFALGYLPNLLKNQLGENSPTYILSLFVMMFVGILMNIGLFHIGQKLYNDKPVDVMELFGHKDRLWSYLWLMIKSGVYIMLGLILFIVPGIILAIKYSLSSYLFILKGRTVNEAMSESSKLVGDNKMKLFLYYAAMIFMSAFFGSIPLFGQLIAIPIIALMYMYLFSLLDKSHKK